uniref:NADAR domain-containing protein n=1 Tax=Neobodo designis TaxID=312471 RepID=A0A7S1QZJ3_NEODS
MATPPEHIIFHSRGKQLAILSNFCPHRLSIDGHVFSCGEAYFHFAKFRAAASVHAAGTEPATQARHRALLGHASKLADASLSGLAAKRLGGKGPQGMRLETDELSAWDAARDDTQRRLCDARTNQGDEAKQVRSALRESGDAVLVHFERGARPDTYWGGKVVDAGTPNVRIVGRNTLGRMWMEVRQRLKSVAETDGPQAHDTAEAREVTACPKRHRPESTMP